jgi:uncharacterized protein YkwD
MRVNGRLVVLAVLIAGSLAGCSSVAPAAAGSTAQAFSFENYDRALLSRAIFDETNLARAAQGVPPLRHLAKLDEAADLQAFHMALMFVSEHGNPITGEANAGERASHAGVLWSSCAENVLMEPARPLDGASPADPTYASFARYLVACWMASPPHRANLLNPLLSGMGSSARFAHSVFGTPEVFASQVFIVRP